MKKLFLVAAMSVFFFASAPGVSDAGVKENIGCGLGSEIYGGGGDPGVLIQTFLVTTNGICANNLFGISSGTLGCEKPATLVQNERLMEFVAANMDNLAKDISMGNGESLATVAELMQVASADRTAFFGKLQSNFTVIFTDEAIEAGQVIDNIFTVANG